jgi:hypothetical protein
MAVILKYRLPFQWIMIITHYSHQPVYWSIHKMTMAAAGYRTKKELKESIGKRLGYRETSLFGNEFKPTGTNVLVGPSEYDRKWFASVVTQDGIIVKVS